MKNFLAVDTSGKHLTVIAAKDGEIFLSRTDDCAMRHSVVLMEEVDKLLKRAELSLNDCDFFAAAVGPGSFTGIRIGISAMKGFCLACGKPSLPVTTFDEMAYNGIGDKKFLALVDALHGHYYVCGYDRGEVVLPPAYLDEEEVLRLMNEEGFAACAFERLPLADKAEVEILDPARGLEKAVLALSERGEFKELEALYIRKSQAEENL